MGNVIPKFSHLNFKCLKFRFRLWRDQIGLHIGQVGIRFRCDPANGGPPRPVGTPLLAGSLEGKEDSARAKRMPIWHFIIITCIIFSFVPSSFSGTKRDSKQVQIYRDKGYEAQRLGNLDMALSYYQKAIELNPYYAVAYNDIGIVLEAKGMTDKAKDAYLRAISLDPNYLSAYYNLAALYEKEGDFDQAAYYWRMRINLGDWSDGWTWKAREHLEGLGESGNLDISKIPPTGDFGFVSNPKRDAEYHLYRGRQYVAAGNYIAALKELNAAIILDPHNKEIKQLLENTQRKVLLYN